MVGRISLLCADRRRGVADVFLWKRLKIGFEQHGSLILAQRTKRVEIRALVFCKLHW